MPATVLGRVRQEGIALQQFEKAHKADREIVLAAVLHDGKALQHAAAELRASKDIVLAAVQQYGPALQFASDALKADTEVVLAAIRQNGNAIRYAAPPSRADRAIITAAVASDGLHLMIASTALKADHDVVLAAVRKSGHALAYASAELQANRDVVLAAVQQAGLAIKHASAELQADRAIVLAGVVNDSSVLLTGGPLLCQPFRADRTILLAAAEQHGLRSLRCAPEAIWADREVVFAAIRHSRDCFLAGSLQRASAAILADREVMLCAVSRDGAVLSLCSDALKDDAAIVMVAVTQGTVAGMQDTPCLGMASTARRADRSIVLAAVAQDGRALQHAALALRAERGVVKVAICAPNEHDRPGSRYRSTPQMTARDVLGWAAPELREDAVLRTMAGIGVEALVREIVSGRHTFDVVALVELSDAAVIALQRRRISMALAERVAKAVAVPDGPVHKRQRREVGEIFGWQ